MKRLLLALVLLLVPAKAFCHFLVLRAFPDVLIQNRSVHLEARFMHPSKEGSEMAFKIKEAGVFHRGKRESIAWIGEGGKIYSARFEVKTPGVYQFYLESEPYFEPAEGKFIKQIAKVYVNAFGLYEGWAQPAGLPAEIVPLTNPFGLWEGCTFVGRVLMEGKPAKGVTVEVEYLNLKGVRDLRTQLLKTDEDGYFIFTIPWAGWWGFSAIGKGGTLKHEGKAYPVEFDAVLWIRVLPKPRGTK